MKLQQVLNNLLKCKSPQELIDEGSNSGLKKTLNVFDLIILGIGAVVGTGIFTIIGSAIAGSADGAGAGPAVVISMILAAVASVFSALYRHYKMRMKIRLHSIYQHQMHLGTKQRNQSLSRIN